MPLPIAEWISCSWNCNLKATTAATKNKLETNKLMFEYQKETKKEIVPGKKHIDPNETYHSIALGIIQQATQKKTTREIKTRFVSYGLK